MHVSDRSPYAIEIGATHLQLLLMFWGYIERSMQTDRFFLFEQCGINFFPNLSLLELCLFSWIKDEKQNHFFFFA